MSNRVPIMGWEYKKDVFSSSKLEEELNTLGEQNWELVGFETFENSSSGYGTETWYVCLFKKPKVVSWKVIHSGAEQNEQD